MNKSNNGFKIIFVFVILSLIVSAYFYFSENKFIQNSKVLKAKILNIRYINQKVRRISLKVVSGKNKNKLFETPMPMFTSYKVGSIVDVRYVDNNLNDVAIDNYLHLHRISIGIFVGMILISIGGFIGILRQR